MAAFTAHQLVGSKKAPKEINWSDPKANVNADQSVQTRCGQSWDFEFYFLYQSFSPLLKEAI